MPVRQKQKQRSDPTSHPFVLMLYHLGWSLSSLEDPQPLAFGGSTVPRAHWQMAPLPDGHFLLLLFLDVTIPDLDVAFKHYEDFLPLHAELRRALKDNGLATRHVILADPEGTVQLVDFAQEDILIDARNEEELTNRLLPLMNLNKLAGGSLTAFPRKTLRQRARELNDWTRIWSSRLGSVSGAGQKEMRQFCFWLHLARLVEQLNLIPNRKLTFSDYGLKGKPPHPVRYLTQIFTPLRETWNLLQGAPMSTIKQIADRAHEAGELAECLQSFSRISAAKFSSQVFAEAFADEELRMTSWRNSLVWSDIQPEEDPTRWLVDPHILNLDEAGFSGLTAWFDAITEDLRRLARQQAVSQERGERPGLQMDVFGTEPPIIAEEDVARITLQSGLRIETEKPERADVARFVALAHCAEWHARLRRPEPIFPSFDVYTKKHAAPAPPDPPKPAPPMDPGLN